MNKLLKLSFSFAIITFISFIISGCSTKKLIKEHNSFAQKELDILKEDKLHNASASLLKTEIIQKKSYIDLSVTKKLKDILAELSILENRIYMIIDEKNNINVPPTILSKILKINSLSKLRTYIEDTTNYTLEISKNKYVVNRPKVIRVFDKKILETDFSNIVFSVKSKSTVAALLTKLSRKVGFSIIYKNDLTQSIDSANSENNQNSGAGAGNYFSNEYVYFTGNKVSDFLSYIEQNFNVYTDINYEDKIITISKYKTKVFNITALNYTITLADAEVSGSSGASSKNAVTSNASFQGIESFKENLERYFEGDSNSKLIFNSDSGQIIVKTTNEKMKETERIINEYNKKYTTQIEIIFDIYEFVLNKSFNLGTDASYKGETGTKLDTTSLKTNILTAITNVDEPKDVEIKFNSDNDFVRYAKSYTYRQIFTNNIPDSINIGNNRKYVASHSTVTTSGQSSDSTSEDQDIKDLTEGIAISILPRVVGNKIIIKNEVKINSTNAVQSAGTKDKSISLPDQDVKTIPGHVVLVSGDRRVIGSYQDFQDIKNYKGVAPIEDFVIMGASGKKFIKKEIVVVLSAKIL